MKIIPRTEWGAKPWRNQPATVPASARRYFLVHYHGGVPSASTGNAVPRDVEVIHRANGWSGIGYNFAVDQAGAIYEGRGWDLAGAHSPPHNTDGIGVYVAIGGDQRPTPAALASVRWLYDEACRRSGRTLTPWWHGRDYPTSCPGPHLIAWVKAGMPTQTTPTKPKPAPAKKPTPKPTVPAFPLPRGHWYGVESRDRRNHSGYYAKDRPGIKQWQAQMKKRGWRIGVDGYFGPASEKVARQFQAEKGIRVDGAVGAQTWAAAWPEPVT